MWRLLAAGGQGQVLAQLATRGLGVLVLVLAHWWAGLGHRAPHCRASEVLGLVLDHWWAELGPRGGGGRLQGQESQS